MTVKQAKWQTKTARSLIAKRPFVGVGIYGDSGTGKTRWGASSPRPLVLLSEQNGLATIHDTNPDADVELINDSATLFDVLSAIKRGSETEVDGQPAWSWGAGRVCQTIVMDSLTDMQRLIIRHVALGPQAADPRAQVGELSFVHWGRIGNYVETMITDLRKLPVNLISICLAEHGVDDRSRRRTTPMLAGRVGKALAQYYAAFGYCYKAEKEGGVMYGIGWELSSQYVTKPAPGFPRSIVCTTTPGQTSLGSLALATLGRDGLTVPHNEHDNADHVQEGVTT